MKVNTVFTDEKSFTALWTSILWRHLSADSSQNTSDYTFTHWSQREKVTHSVQAASVLPLISDIPSVSMVTSCKNRGVVTGVTTRGQAAPTDGKANATWCFLCLRLQMFKGSSLTVKNRGVADVLQQATASNWYCIKHGSINQPSRRRCALQSSLQVLGQGDVSTPPASDTCSQDRWKTLVMKSPNQEKPHFNVSTLI